MYLGVNTRKDLIVYMPISKLTCNDEEIHNPIFLRMSGSEGSSYSFDPRLQHYSQRDPSAPGPYQPYSYQGYALPQVSPWGYGPGPHATLSQNPGNVVNATPLQFRNTFAPHEIPSRAPLAPISVSQPSQVPAISTTSRKRTSQAGPGGPVPKRARRSDAENAGTVTSTSTTDVPITATGPFIPPVGTTTYQHPAFMAFTLILPKDQKNTRTASDVWFCVKGSQMKKIPDIILPNPPDEGLFFEWPKDKVVYPYLACCLCT